MLPARVSSEELILTVLREDYPDASLGTPFEALPMDSLDYVALIHELESNLNVSFPPNVAMKFKDASEILSWVDRGGQ